MSAPAPLLSSLALLQLGGNPNAIFANLLPPIAIAAIFYFIVWRPSAQQRKQQQDTVRKIRPGDEVLTAGGIIGQVVHVAERTSGQPGDEDRITIKSAESRLIVERGRIVRVGGAVAAAARPGA
ncbi:MAG TPA: preprotein translocase subunit YajC [Gemmatirosa sp.]